MEHNMFLRIPPQITRSINYVSKCQKLIDTLNFLVYVFCYVLIPYVEKTSELSWWNFMIVILHIAEKLSLFNYGVLQHEMWTQSFERARNGNLSFFTLPLIFTPFVTGVNLWNASGYYNPYYNCGFRYAYSFFLKDTLGDVIKGTIAALLGLAYLFIAVLNIKLNLQACAVYRNLRDDRFRRRG